MLGSVAGLEVDEIDIESEYDSSLSAPRSFSVETDDNDEPPVSELESNLSADESIV